MNNSVLVFKMDQNSAGLWQAFAPLGQPAGEVLPSWEAPAGSEVTVERLSFWRHEGGRLRYLSLQGEIVVLLKGRVKITDEAGADYQIQAGELGMIPAGFEGTWESLEPVVKVSATLGKSSVQLGAS